MNRAHCTSFWSAPAERSDDGALVWSEERRQFESGVALRLPPHSKTLPYAGGSWKASISFLRMHWDDELISLGRARLRRALIFAAPKEFQGSTESRPTLRFMESVNQPDQHSKLNSGTFTAFLRVAFCTISLSSWRRKGF